MCASLAPDRGIASAKGRVQVLGRVAVLRPEPMGRLLSLACLVAAVGCQAAAAESPPAPAPSSSARAHRESTPKEHAAKGEPKAEPEKEHAAKRAESGRTFALPFVREPNEEDPADRARGFLRELVKDNAAFVRGHDTKYFKPFADSQKPRATLVTCSDSRVQSHAFDASPDNDLFTIRNIGNQIATARRVGPVRRRASEDSAPRHPGPFGLRRGQGGDGRLFAAAGADPSRARDHRPFADRCQGAAREAGEDR